MCLIRNRLFVIFEKNTDKIMNYKKLNNELKTEAIQLGLCKEWQDEWNVETDKQKLIDKYFKGLDFPLKYHWPSNDYIKKNFEQPILRKNHILVDDKYSLLNPKEAVILGDSASTIRVNGFYHSVIYIRDVSSGRITARNRSFVIIHLFESSFVKIEAFDSANVLVLKHSKDVTIEASENVKIKNDFDYLK